MLSMSDSGMPIVAYSLGGLSLTLATLSQLARPFESGGGNAALLG